MTGARQARVVLLTKDPVPGQVKTRMIPLLGAEGAAALHRELVAGTLSAVQASGLPAEVHLAGDLHGDFATWIREQGFAVHAQGDGDLGARLRRAMAGPGRLLALGTDCPHLDPAWLVRAAARPEPVVIGPAEDGGYWMLAIDAPRAALFARIAWSTDAVFTTTCARAAALPIAIAPVCYDIDEPADLLRLLADPRCPPALFRRFSR